MNKRIEVVGEVNGVPIVAIVTDHDHEDCDCDECRKDRGK